MSYLLIQPNEEEPKTTYTEKYAFLNSIRISYKRRYKSVSDPNRKHNLIPRYLNDALNDSVIVKEQNLLDSNLIPLKTGYFPKCSNLEMSTFDNSSFRISKERPIDLINKRNHPSLQILEAKVPYSIENFTRKRNLNASLGDFEVADLSELDKLVFNHTKPNSHERYSKIDCLQEINQYNTPKMPSLVASGMQTPFNVTFRPEERWTERPKKVRRFPREIFCQIKKKRLFI